MLKSLGHGIVALVAAVGIVVSPTVGLAVAEPTGETDVVTTTPLPPPAEIPPPETEAPPSQEPPAEAPPSAEPPAQEAPPAETLPEQPVPEPSTTPSADPPVSESTEEDPPSADQPPAETTPSALPSDDEMEQAPETTPAIEPSQGQPSVNGTESSQSSTEQATVTSSDEAPVVAIIPGPPSVDQADVQQAFAGEPLVEKPVPVSTTETDMAYEQIRSSLPDRNSDNADRNRGHDQWDGRVKPWSQDWIRYDNPRHPGPVFCNPYHDRDIKIFYVYQGHQYVRVIPPRQSIFVDVDVHVQGVNSFTAVHVKAGNVVVDVNVGTFHHPAYVPPVQQNVHVKVVVNNHYYPQPFTVKKVVDCGYDQVRRKTRVVFDDTYVAWGNWRGQGKDRHFALEESATYPGMYGKAAEVVAAPPEPYIKASQPRNVAAETSLASNEGLMIGGGALVLALLIGLLARALIRRNGTPPQHS